MTEREVMWWIKNNLGPIIKDSVHPPYTEDWLAAIAMREVGVLLYKCLPHNKRLADIAPIMKGDFSQRSGETERQYHGFSFWQIDIDSFKSFIQSGDWKDPAKSCQFAVKVLDSKRAYLQGKIPDDILDRATTAAYNCGEGNVLKSIHANEDIDSRTFNHDYSKSVFRFRELYKSLV